MYLSTNTDYFVIKYGTGEARSIEERIKICADAGFKYVDIALCGGKTKLNPTHFDDYAEISKRLREYCDSLGVTVNQTHAPFVFEVRDNPKAMARAVEASAILGAENMVVHADASVNKDGSYCHDYDFNKICDFYAPYVEQAKKLNVHIAVENLFEDNPASKERKRWTSVVEEQLAVIEHFDDPVVNACWDFGHGRVTYGDKQLEALAKLGKHLAATHVHDNMISRDLHQHVFLAGTDWTEIMKFLHSSGYDKGFTFEMVYGKYPEALVPDFMKFQYKCGQYMINEMK